MRGGLHGLGLSGLCVQGLRSRSLGTGSSIKSTFGGEGLRFRA